MSSSTYLKCSGNFRIGRAEIQALALERTRMGPYLRPVKLGRLHHSRAVFQFELCLSQTFIHRTTPGHDRQSFTGTRFSNFL